MLSAETNKVALCFHQKLILVRLNQKIQLHNYLLPLTLKPRFTQGLVCSVNTFTLNTAEPLTGEPVLKGRPKI